MTRASSAPGLRRQVSDSRVICNDHFEASFAPRAGGRLLVLRHVVHGDIVVPMDNRSFDPTNWPKAGAFPLFPFHNRLRDAAFRLEGRTTRLLPNMANGRDVMHGPAQRRPWRVSETGPDYLEMTLTYRADDDWPFDFSATQRFRLQENCLIVRLSLTNSGKALMPGGMGWHPYFRPSPDGNIQITAARVWHPFAPGNPFAHVTHNSRGWDGQFARDVTRHYSGWTIAMARIGEGTTISLSGDTSLSCLAALHKNDYLCLEPASHVAGALETLPELCPETGLRLLRPGETMSGVSILSVV
jgi:aldose 1-epimerase